LNIGVTYARGGADKVLDFVARVWVRLADFKMRNEYTYDQSTFNALLGPNEPNQVCTFSSLAFYYFFSFNFILLAFISHFAPFVLPTTGLLRSFENSAT
jgi:hypothetical protein